MKKAGLLVAAAIVIVSNALVLAGVARNRAGAPVETIQLTQRELPAGFRQKEDTGVSLHLNSNHYGVFYREKNAWLDRARLDSLGFDTAAALRDRKHQPLPRPAYIALEYNGPAWEQWARRAQDTKPFNRISLDMQSRLFPIDAAKSPEALLQKYSDRQKYLIVRGVIRAFVNTGTGTNQLEGSVSEILPQNIHVPPPLASSFSTASYTVTLAYGHRFEPWVIGH